jgi:small subunit ribosomal protein S17
MAKAKEGKGAQSAPKARNIGLGIEPPEKVCTDRKCPYHGRLPVRGSVIDGFVKGTKMMGTIVVQRERRVYDTKYERYKRKTHKYSAHLPGCMSVKEDQKVTIAECRPLSKTVKFVVVKVHEGQ